MKLLVHAHTIFSDGELSPRELARLAFRRGFNAVLASDHFESLTRESFHELVEECREIKDCLLIPGCERSWEGYHVLALGVYQWLDTPTLQYWAARVRSDGGITVLAHPTRYRCQIPEQILAECDAVEVWNSKAPYDGMVGPNPLAYPLLGASRFPLCGQDLHGIRHATSVSVELKRPCSTPEEILRRLRRGEYRMTNGLFQFGSNLSPAACRLLRLFHGVRRFGVDRAVTIRRNWL